MNTAVYETSLYSGSFQDFKQETQIKISNLYANVRGTHSMGVEISKAALIEPKYPDKYEERLKRIGDNMDERLQDHKTDAEELILHLKNKKIKWYRY